MTDDNRGNIFLFRGCLSGVLILLPFWALVIYLLYRYLS